ncbi:hypothetical protein SELMODRAFT_430800 [Selaginella moellendorffii]|uniref:Uncharacterized protein n=1 Tax=Selaginella moellendorffii TaxID=88036 RepID=D8TAK3_SELML|nr:hypothetical protein SELMODRAFT_430800 [Selaginella moellendorffii]
MAGAMELDIWKSRLHSSARTGLACLIAAVLLEYAHGYVKWTSFPVFSFVLSFVLLSECPSLEMVIRDSWSVILGAIQGLALGMLVINLFGPTVSIWTSLLCIFWSSMVVAYPSFSSLLTKRIALTGVTHLHVVAYARQESMDRIFYPLKLGATMMLSVSCCLVALTFPVPKLASTKVKQQIVQSTRVISRAFDALLASFCTMERCGCHSLRFQSKSLVEAGSKLVSDIPRLECALFFKAKAFGTSGKRLDKLMLHLKAMEMAKVISIDHATIVLLEDPFTRIREWSKLVLMAPGGTGNDKLLEDGTDIIGSLNEALEIAVGSFDTKDPSQLEAHFSCLFFVQNMRLFLAEARGALKGGTSKPARSMEDLKRVSGSQCQPCKGEIDHINDKRTISRWLLDLYDREQFILALKISLAMVLGAFAGFMYDRSHTIWTTLIIGMGFNARRDASLRISDIRLHGVVLGTLYGYLVSFYTLRYPAMISIVALAAWIVFTSFMKHSRLYGPLGNVSALIGAIFLVGHRKRVPLDRLAMLRMAETFLGIAAFVAVDYLILPRRNSSAMARAKATASADKIKRCTRAAVSACADCEDGSTMEGAERDAGLAVAELEALVEEMKMEPCGMHDLLEERAFTKIVRSQKRILGLIQTLVIFALELRRISGCEHLQLSALDLLTLKEGGGDVEDQSKGGIDLVDSCRTKFLLGRRTGSWEEILVSGALAFNVQELLLEFSKMERNILKLVKTGNVKII